MISSQSAGPRPEDVRTTEAIIAAMYEVISGPAGVERDWTRFRSLFQPEARFILAVSRPGEHPRVRVLGIDEYIRRTAPFFETESFWERQREARKESFGNIAQVWSAYECRREQHAPPYQEGVNSIQLFFDAARWWIVSVMWNTERG
jgi:hypothetical protein